MKKLIALILILVITSFIVVSKDSQSKGILFALNENHRFIDAIYVEKPDKNAEKYKWQYIKERLFDGATENVYHIKGPILIALQGASQQDSIVVNEIIQELRTIIPSKTINYFETFTGTTIDVLEMGKFNAQYKGISADVLMGSTIIMDFDHDPNKSTIIHSQGTVNVLLPKNIGNISSTRLFRISTEKEKTYPHSILFDFDRELSKNELMKYIQYEFLRSLCFINDNDWLTNSLDEKDNFETIFCNTLHNPENSKFTEEDKFLLQKLYSDDFIDQFKTYMYANYPWRYASSFINKKEHEFKVFGIIVSIGTLVFILIFSFFQNKKYKYTYLNYLFPIFFIFIHFINLYNIYVYLTSFNSITSWFPSMVSAFFISIFAALLTSIFIMGLEKIILKENKHFSYKLVLKVMFTFVSFLIPVILFFIFESDTEGFLEFFSPYLFFSAGLSLARGILIYLNHFSESLVKEKDLELSRLKEAKAEAEVKMLQSQINPHFLYNALNSIASLAHTDADKTEKMALSLSDLFRHSINRKGIKVNTLKDELHLVRNYLEIEQIRFGDRLVFSINVDPDLLAVEIPMFILQPLVENAIKHGVSKIEGQGKIDLQIVPKNNGFLISVQNNGPDFPEGLVSGHGLQTVYDLLRFSYGDKAEISWHNKPKKEITIYIDTVSK